MAVALARRYRPRRFADLLAQDHVAATLRGAVARGRVGHGYLLTGPRGVGKTTAARVLAMALNCERRAPDEGEPCGECTNCQRIWNGSASLDVVEIDAASNRGVDDARDLRERAMYAASQEGHHKVYIVDEAHMLTREAWNALLKILEEPPPGVVFVFATTEPQKIFNAAAPVLSRLQRFDFRRIAPDVIRARLAEVLAAEGIAFDDDALRLVARHADGGMRDGLSLLDQVLSFGEGTVTVDRVRDTLGLIADDLYAETLAILAERRSADVFPLVDRLVDGGADLAVYTGGVGELLRGLLMRRLGVAPAELTQGMREALETWHAEFAPGDVVRMLRLLADEEQAIRRSGSPRLVVETLLLRWTMLDRMVDLEAVLAGRGAEPAARPAPRGAGAPAATSRRGSPGTPAAEPAPASPPAPIESVPFTLEALGQAWEQVVELARPLSRFLAEALQHARPVEVAPPRLVVELDATGAHLATQLDRHREALARALHALVGAPVEFAYRQESAPPPARERRLSESGLRAERLQRGRQQDPALDAAADSLDLEVVD